MAQRGFKPLDTQAESLRSGLRDSPALAIEVNLTNALDPRQHVVRRLATDAHQLGANNSRYEIARQIKNFLWSRAFESLAKNRRHRSGQRLHLRPEGHPDMSLALFIDMQIDPARVGAFVVLPTVFQLELFAGAGFLFLRVVGLGAECLRPFVFRKRFNQIDDFIQLGGYIVMTNLPLL